MNVGRFRSASEAARAMGVPAPTYSGHENGNRGITQPTAERYARFFKVSPEWLLFERGEPPRGAKPPSPPEGTGSGSPTERPSSNLGDVVSLRTIRGPRLPIMGRAAGSADGRMVMDAGNTGSTSMPSSLEDVPDAYGVFVHGVSMLERFQPGELLHVNPHRPVRKGDDVVAQVQDDDGNLAGYVKRFVSRSDAQLVLEQLNPTEGESRTLRFPGKRVVSVHKVVGTGEP